MLPWILGGHMGYLANDEQAYRRNPQTVAPRLVISLIILLGLFLFAGLLRLSWLFIVGD